MRIVLLGPQGAGKGTQAQRLASQTGALHISTGELVREEIASGSRLGVIVKEYNDQGYLVPDEIIIGMVTSHLEPHSHWILDGFPRNVPQAEALSVMLSRAGSGLDAVIALEAPDSVVIERLAGRRHSLATGKIYHVSNNPAPASDPGPFIQRDDDLPAMIQRRLDLYHRETEPVKSYYAAAHLLVEIDACQPMDAVTAAILAARPAGGLTARGTASIGHVAR